MYTHIFYQLQKQRMTLLPADAATVSRRHSDTTTHFIFFSSDRLVSVVLVTGHDSSLYIYTTNTCTERADKYR